MMITETLKSFFLQGAFAPINNEIHTEQLKIIKGEIPNHLNGILYRNGPNPQFPDNDAHWFEGDGMLHAIKINQGKVGYQNRWIRTERFLAENKAGQRLSGTLNNPNSYDPVFANISASTANTNIIQHAGKLLALQETSVATEIDPSDLQTKGTWDYHGKIAQMSAHPHFDFTTGNMHNYAYSFDNNDIIYYIVDHLGNVIKAEQFTAPYCSFMHDFFITKDYGIFPILPLTFNMERVTQGKPALCWEPEKNAHIGIMPHSGTAVEMIWFAMDPFYTYHYMNAFQDGDEIVLDAMKSKQAGLFPDESGNVPSLANSLSYLTRFRLNLHSRKVREEQLDSIPAEFPRFDERFTGRPYRHGFVAANLSLKTSDDNFDSIIHYDLEKQSRIIREFGVGNIPNEPIFVPRTNDVAEGDGYVLSIVYNSAADTSYLYILDAMNIDKEPLAIVQLPQRVPLGFHGNWYSTKI